MTNPSALTTKVRLNPMIVINDKNNMCRTAVKYKQRSSGTKQPELFLNDDMTSHNICFTKLAKLSESLHKSDQSKRTAEFSELDCLDKDNVFTADAQSNPMILINGRKRVSNNATGNKQRSYRTKQLKNNVNDDMGSHNIYFTKLAKTSNRVHKFNKPERTVRFNKLGSLNILTLPISKLKSFYKDEMGTFIVVMGLDKPIAVRDSINEINNILNRSR